MTVHDDSDRPDSQLLTPIIHLQDSPYQELITLGAETARNFLPKLPDDVERCNLFPAAENFLPEAIDGSLRLMAATYIMLHIHPQMHSESLITGIKENLVSMYDKLREQFATRGEIYGASLGHIQRYFMGHGIEFIATPPPRAKDSASVAAENRSLRDGDFAAKSFLNHGDLVKCIDTMSKEMETAIASKLEQIRRTKVSAGERIEFLR